MSDYNFHTGSMVSADGEPLFMLVDVSYIFNDGVILPLQRYGLARFEFDLAPSDSAGVGRVGCERTLCSLVAAPGAKTVPIDAALS